MSLRGVPDRLAALYASIACSVLVVKRTATIESVAELSNLLNRGVPVGDYEAGLAAAVRLIYGSNCKRELNPAYLVLLMDGPSIANLFRIEGIVNIQWNQQEKGFVVTDLSRTPRAGEIAVNGAEAHEALFTDTMIHTHQYQPGTPYFGTGRQSGSQPRRSNRPRSDYNRDNRDDRNNSNGRTDDGRDDRGNNNRAPRTSGSNRGQRDSRVPRGNRSDDGRRDGPRRGAPHGRRRDDHVSIHGAGPIQGIQPRKQPLIAPMSTSQCVEIQQAALAATKDHRRDVQMVSMSAVLDNKILPWVGRIEETKAVINEGAQFALSGFPPITPSGAQPVASTAASVATSAETSTVGAGIAGGAGIASNTSIASVSTAGETAKKPKAPTALELASSADWY